MWITQNHEFDEPSDKNSTLKLSCREWVIRSDQRWVAFSLDLWPVKVLEIIMYSLFFDKIRNEELTNIMFQINIDGKDIGIFTKFVLGINRTKRILGVISTRKQSRKEFDKNVTSHLIIMSNYALKCNDISGTLKTKKVSESVVRISTTFDARMTQLL